MPSEPSGSIPPRASFAGDAGSIVAADPARTPAKIMSMDGVFSDMYDRLVADADDLPGLIAYGFYQLEKREWARAHLNKTGVSPSLKEVTEFCDRYQQSAMKSLKERADGILFEYAKVFLDEQYPAIQEKAFNDKASLELSKVLEKITQMSTFRHHIISHIVGFTFFLILVWFVLHVIPMEPHIASFFGIGTATSPPH